MAEKRKGESRRRRLRILLCAHEYPPMGSGIAYVVKNLAAALGAAGHAVRVCSPMGPDVRLGSRNLIERTGGIGILRFWEAVRRHLSQRGEEYDIVWCHNPLFRRAVEHPGLLFTVHTTYLQRSRTNPATGVAFSLYNAYMRLRERRAYRAMRTARFTVTSALTATELEELGVESKIVLIPNGVDTATFAPGRKQALRKELRLPAGNVLLNVGRMMPQKRQALLIERFSEAAGKKDLLVIAGDGPLRKEVETAAHEKENVLLTGRIPQERLLAYYQAADYIVMPSTYEGQPLALLEAMSCGCIPILSPIPIFEETVAEEKIGLILDFEKQDAAATLKAFVAKDRKGEAARLARQMRRRDWKEIVKQYEKVLEAMR